MKWSILIMIGVFIYAVMAIYCITKKEKMNSGKCKGCSRSGMCLNVSSAPNGKVFDPNRPNDVSCIDDKKNKSKI